MADELRHCPDGHVCRRAEFVGEFCRGTCAYQDHSSETWRAYTEAREVASWPKAKRIEQYGLVKKARGEDEAVRLVANVNRIWQERDADREVTA